MIFNTNTQKCISETATNIKSQLKCGNNYQQHYIKIHKYEY